MKTPDQIIDEALGILDPVEDAITNNKITVPKTVVKSDEDDIDNDYKYQRENFYNLVERGQDAIEGILELAKLLDDAVGDIVISISDNALETQFGCFRFTTKLIDGDYPDYNKAIPGGGDKVFECNRKQLRDALIRTSVMSNEVYKNVKLSLTSNRLTLFTNNPLLEQAEEVVGVSYSGEAIEIGFNVNFLIEALSVMGGERVHVELSGETSPCLITDPQDSGAKFVVSPMII